MNSGFIHHQEETQLDAPLTLAALQNLKQLEMLNLEHTHVRDGALSPLSSFQQLRYISLKSTSLADISLYYLSSIPKLTSLSICDAVLTNYGLDTFEPPATLKMMDLTGCWLLTRDAILSFCRIHPQIEVRHEITKVPFEQSGPNRSPSSRLNSRTVQEPKKKGITSLSPSFIGIFFKHLRLKALMTNIIFNFNCFETDQRLKYTRDELLALQSMSVPFVYDHERDSALFE